MLSPMGNLRKFNNLSEHLRTKLEKKLEEMPRFVEYLFHITHRNPDPEKHEGERIVPATFQLQPVTYSIEDPGTSYEEVVEGKDGKKSTVTKYRDKGRKTVGLCKPTLDGKGEVSGNDGSGFRSVMVYRHDKAKIRLDLKNSDDIDTWAYLEMHPGFPGGMFPDENIGNWFERIDIKKDAKRRNEVRNKRIDAEYLANAMDLNEQREFAAAMGWEELEDGEVQKDRIMTIASTDPDGFNNMLTNKKLPVRAAIARGEKAGILAWNPVEYKYTYSNTGETVVALGRRDDLDRYDAMADWLLTDKTGQKFLERLLQAIKAKPIPA